ncbi:DivIVA domain-containing protein [Nocardia bhagyanarayanae]|uniref:DivIVA domain-containing protein n=1 Tax=Nocardia bhagyanarayanae TaxID=1215925 RepID=A0A543FAA9_9NOCA|nr:DivIVA domain-containing protein [Nocardia bhagyanarayanae]TQM30768.1 DivIVA domain-containing protein [Nocardia bhagyanarayanae]
MLTLLLYVLIVGLVAAVLFLLASAVFGRGEELGPLPEGTTATVLPAEGITGADVRALRFQQVVRGYKAGEVDWALARLAARIDELQLQLAHARGETPQMGKASVETAARQENPAPQHDTANSARPDAVNSARPDAVVASRDDTEHAASPWPAPSTPEQP